LDSNNEEAIYVLKRINEDKFLDGTTEPNVFVEDNLWGAHVVTSYYINERRILQISGKGQGQFLLPVGEYVLLIRSEMYGETTRMVSIKSKRSKIHIKTFYSNMRLSVDIVTKEV